MYYQRMSILLLNFEADVLDRDTKSPGLILLEKEHEVSLLVIGPNSGEGR